MHTNVQYNHFQKYTIQMCPGMTFKFNTSQIASKRGPVAVTCRPMVQCLTKSLGGMVPPREPAHVTSALRSCSAPRPPRSRLYAAAGDQVAVVGRDGLDFAVEQVLFYLHVAAGSGQLSQLRRGGGEIRERQEVCGNGLKPRLI